MYRFESNKTKSSFFFDFLYIQHTHTHIYTSLLLSFLSKLLVTYLSMHSIYLSIYSRRGSLPLFCPFGSNFLKDSPIIYFHSIYLPIIPLILTSPSSSSSSSFGTVHHPAPSYCRTATDPLTLTLSVLRCNQSKYDWDRIG